MKTLEDAAKTYWRYGQHLAALRTPEEREQFLMFTVAPTAAGTTSQHERRLLGKLLNREAAVATG